jgi:hypothetical protein
MMNNRDRELALVARTLRNFDRFHQRGPNLSAWWERRVRLQCSHSKAREAFEPNCALPFSPVDRQGRTLGAGANPRWRRSQVAQDPTDSDISGAPQSRSDLIVWGMLAIWCVVPEPIICAGSQSSRILSVTRT